MTKETRVDVKLHCGHDSYVLVPAFEVYRSSMNGAPAMTWCDICERYSVIRSESVKAHV